MMTKRPYTPANPPPPKRPTTSHARIEESPSSDDFQLAIPILDGLCEDIRFKITKTVSPRKTSIISQYIGRFTTHTKSSAGSTILSTRRLFWQTSNTNGTISSWYYKEALLRARAWPKRRQSCLTVRAFLVG